MTPCHTREACGSAGYVSQLRRTKVGSIDIDCAITVEDLQKRCDQGDIDSCFTKISEVLIDMPHCHIQNKTESIKRFLNGNPIVYENNKQVEHAVFDGEGQLLGIGRISQYMLHPKTIMAIPV